MKKVHINVTASDIENFERFKCPIHLAVERCKAFAGQKVIVGLTMVYVGNRFYFLPEKAKRFISLFCLGSAGRKNLKPFRLTLEV